MVKIAVWAGFLSSWSELPAQFPEDDVVVARDESELSRVAGAEIALGTNIGTRVRALLQAAPDLRWYHTVGAGVDDLVTIPELRARGIVLTNNSGSYDIPIAEHVIATILAAAKRLHLYRDQQARHQWKEQRHGELRDATLVVYGLGSIGAEVARLGAGLGMRVVGIRRRQGAVPGVSLVVPPDQLAAIAAEADYLVVATPLTAATRGAVSREVLARMKPTAWLVNIARGQVVDEAALVDALREGRIGGAALDTMNVEPLPAEHPLWTFPNVIITPHSSNSSPHLRERTVALFLDNLRRYKAGEPLHNVVDLEAGY